MYMHKYIQEHFSERKDKDFSGRKAQTIQYNEVKRPTPNHIIVTFQKTKDKGKIPKSSWEEKVTHEVWRIKMACQLTAGLESRNQWSNVFTGLRKIISNLELYT